MPDYTASLLSSSEQFVVEYRKKGGAIWNEMSGGEKDTIEQAIKRRDDVAALWKSHEYRILRRTTLTEIVDLPK